ncbi:hypothetical protein BT67DRAFT_439665 [Trichocladium antarcticum]|uniref:SprT-like domain-containing protein n=1 Tax=Trichocladium antarcticum TaxID=1450529 RepID=A0AAN6URQ7_9PEZI|nr:hypothetical protein BT67DRAFT_439665 [Trichocladium antarcticum]
MELPGAGGDRHPPNRLSDYPFKRRAADTVDDDHHRHPRHKRPRHVQYTQYADPVAYKAADDPFPSYTPLHHPHPRHRYASPHSHLSSPEPSGAPAMERTASGHSIHPDPTERCGSTELLEDDKAAQRVRDHLATFRRRNPDSKHERILRSIITPRRRQPHHHQHHHHHRREADEYPVDNDALESILSAANNLFFNGRLSQRVMWDWSHDSSTRYDSRVIGTTALRRASTTTRGFETLIVLSSTILRDARFSRRLLISTFLHELIHSYLFICCGFRARSCGGHTKGFREIARVIDEWAGEESGLFLSRVEADLEVFRLDAGCSGQGNDEGGGGGAEESRDGRGPVGVYPCSGMRISDEQEYAVSAAVAVAAAPGPGPQEVVRYFGGSGVAPKPGSSMGSQQQVAYYPTGGGGDGDIWWRHRRNTRPVYVYSGDEPTASYVHPDSMVQWL